MSCWDRKISAFLLQTSVCDLYVQSDIAVTCHFEFFNDLDYVSMRLLCPGVFMVVVNCKVMDVSVADVERKGIKRKIIVVYSVYVC